MELRFGVTHFLIFGDNLYHRRVQNSATLRDVMHGEMMAYICSTRFHEIAFVSVLLKIDEDENKVGLQSAECSFSELLVCK